MLHSTTSTKTRSNVNLALQRWDKEQETKKGNTERERDCDEGSACMYPPTKG